MKVAVWYFQAGAKNVKRVLINVKENGSAGDDLRALCVCKNLESQSFTDETGLKWVIFMNELGLYEDREFCPTAEKVLRKIHLNWGKGPLCGNYVVLTYRYNEETDQEVKEDIPNVSFQEFINKYNHAIDNYRLRI